MKNFLRVIVLSVSIPAIFFTIGYLLWENELQYINPTELPEDYVQVRVMDTVELEDVLGESNGKPFFLHYYNPYCPCSKFNYSHYQALIDQYKDDFNLFLVIREMDRDILKEIKENVQAKVTLIIDQDGKIAKQTGVYSTPQAVLLNSDYTLYYRGNYSRTRYCTTKNFNYAEMAIDSLLEGKKAPDFGYFAVTSYGCSLDKKREFYQTLFSMN